MDNQGKQNENLFQELMVRSITGDLLSNPEQEQLDKWLAEKPGNQREYQDLKTAALLLRAGRERKPDTMAAWEKVRERTQAAQVRTFRISGWMKYAAAAILILGATTWFYRSYRPASSERIAVEQANKPGIFHAIQQHSGTKISIIVPQGAQYDLELPDKSHVWLNSNSQISYQAGLSHQAIREIFLQGEAYFKVAKDKKHPFIVRTAKMDVEAVGTAFNVSAYPADAYTQTTLVEGIVNVSDKSGFKRQIRAGGKVIIANHEKQLQPLVQNRQPLYKDFAWKDGVFVFDNMELSEIGDKISRWYNIKIIFRNDAARTLRFTGSIAKNNSLDMVLKLISASTDVQFEQKGNLLYIQKP